MRTLVVHTGAIGDFLLACPTLSILARDSTLELAGDPERHELAVAAGIARAAHRLDAIDFHTLFAEPSAKLKAFLRAFDRVIVWMRDDDGKLRRALEACGPARIEVFPGLPEAGWTRHASDYYARCFGLESPPPLRLGLAPEEPPLDVVIHPGSGSAKKNWPLENFQELARALAVAGRQIAWSLGPAEEESLATTLFAEETLRGLPLLALARRLSTARLYLGNDSGITHLAAALGLPTLAIFARTDPAIWAPRGDRVRILRGDPWPTPTAVANAALHVLELDMRK